MKQFEYVRAGSVDEALQYLSDGKTSILAGGTDLLHEMKRGISAPERLVSIKSIPGLRDVAVSDDSLRIGSLVSVDEVARNETIAGTTPLLAQAASEVASPQLRNMGTIAGNILQRPRCWYYRDTATHCLRKGGERCFAVTGENRFHAIFGGGPCHIVCPSDIAPALVALGAELEIQTEEGQQRVPIGKFFRTPKEDPHRENMLSQYDIVTAIRIPLPAAGSRGVFLKASERRVWDFALASVASQVVLSEDGTVDEAEIVLGGVAPNPWRSAEAIEALRGKQLTKETCRSAAEAAVSVAKPMKGNGYKVDLTRSIISAALGALAEAG